MSKHAPTPEWPEWPFMRAEMDCLTEVIEAYRQQSDRTLSTAYPLLDAARSSTDTLCDLCAKHNLRDSYVIARTVYETAVNACFVVVAGSDVAERAWRHAHQKALRDLDRTIMLAGRQMVSVKWSGADVALADEKNKELLKEFTNRKGREITAWTPETVLERLERIHAECGDDAVTGLVFGLLVYRHGSEIAHGTLHGALFALGGTQPVGFPRSIQDLADYRIDHCRMLLMLIGFSIESLIGVLARKVGRVDLASRAKEAQRAFSNRRRPELDAQGATAWNVKPPNAATQASESTRS